MDFVKSSYVLVLRISVSPAARVAVEHVVPVAMILHRHQCRFRAIAVKLAIGPGPDEDPGLRVCVDPGACAAGAAFIEGAPG
jgi:hypothetical protein